MLPEFVLSPGPMHERTAMKAASGTARPWQACVRAKNRSEQTAARGHLLLALRASPLLVELDDAKRAPPTPQDWCGPDSSEEELGPDNMEFMESYGRAEQRLWQLTRAASHGDGGAAA